METHYSKHLDKKVTVPKPVAILYDNGLSCWTEDLDGRKIIESTDKRRVYFMTQGEGYEVVVKASYDDEG